MSGEVESPVAFGGRALRGAWNTMLSIYYANSVPWRLLKSGALFFLGFFLWAGSNLLRAYFGDVWLLRYTLAYGFVLVAYGPFHHLVVIPAYQRFRRAGRRVSLGEHLHLPNASLAVFLALVVVLGTFPVGAMTIDFRSAVGGGGADIAPDLACVKSTGGDTTTVHCHLSESRGVDRVEVYTDGERIAVDREPPFEFTVRADELREGTGGKRFRVDLLAPDGTLARRYSRTLPMIPEG